MLTKQATLLTAAYLNDVNDSASGGAVVSVPSGAPSPAVSQTIPGDRIVLDDATALALSDTTVGTLYGGVYQYVGTFLTSTASPVLGAVAFFRAADIGVTYQVTPDAQPTAAIPTYIAGIFINAITKGNWGWIQVSGAAGVLFDQGVLTNVQAGYSVSAKISPTLTGSADVGAAAGVAVTPALLGVAVGLPVSSTVSTVMLTRGLFCGRI